MFEDLKIDESRLIQPIEMVVKNDESPELKIHVYEHEIYIQSNNHTWSLVGEVKREFEQNINPDNKIWKYTKEHLKCFFESLSKMFD